MRGGGFGVQLRCAAPRNDGRSGEAAHKGKNGTEDGADEGADDGDPGVAPVGVALALDGQDEVCDAGAEVTGGVDGVAGGAAQGVTDDDDDECDTEGAHCRFGVAGDVDPQDQHGCADDFCDEVPAVVADGGAGGEYGELGCGVAVLVEVGLVGEPHDDGTDEGAEELGEDVDGDVHRCDGDACGEFHLGVEHVADDLSQRHCWVEVSAGCVGDVDACEDCEAPAEVDEEPAAAIALGLGEDCGCDDAAAQEEEDCCPHEFGHENLSAAQRGC